MPWKCRSRLALGGAALAAAAVAAAAPPARAGVVTYRLGEQDFADGQGPVLVEQARAAGANEVAPFDGTVFGDDRTRKFGRLSFRYAVAPPTAAGDGSLTLGLVGLDSPPGDGPTVRVFFDGVEQPNAAFAGVSAGAFRSSASVVTVPVPAGFLADGELTVTVKAFRRSPGYPGNAIEADFSTLAVPMTPATPGGGGSNPGGGGTDPGGGGTDPGGNGGNNGGGGTNNGGGDTDPPPHSVPLPPAAWAGLAGLGLAVAARRKVRLT
ncbi:MAG TPA: MYXO-CTERM sorting domain-containing protein [Humisphaera sp.]